MNVKTEIGASRDLGRLIVQFGDAQWRFGEDRVYRLVGGDERDRMEARQWISLFVPDAIIGRPPFQVKRTPSEGHGGGIQHVLSPAERRSRSIRLYS